MHWNGEKHDMLGLEGYLALVAALRILEHLKSHHVRKNNDQPLANYITEDTVTYLTSELRMHASCALPTNSTTYSFLQINMPPPIDLQSIRKEGRMTLALQAYKDGHFTSIRGAANAYDIPESTLQSRVKGCPAQRDLRPTNTKLIDLEELTLV
ncbi:hypothetical protein VF21_10037 [Pseudogymnoascus sp. 05NY08]|nr:hypothetical protein VF21_10037 [Pseudogymnoascus sp. 05NY08]